MNGEKLTIKEKQFLLGHARQTIAQKLGLIDFDPPTKQELQSIGSHVQEKRGCFVTVHKKGQLRGCIGIFESKSPLWRNVEDMAEQAAFHDPRFPPLMGKEFRDLDIEISVLSPLRKIKSVEEIKVGEHGIYITSGYHRGVLLPQVATEQEWDRDTFLDHTCIKAGLPEGAWRKPEVTIEIFDAEVFGERSIAAKMAVVRFEEIIGHAEVIERLKRDVAGDRLAHAYLFVGPNGIGKGAVARLLGAAAFCAAKDVSKRPCGECIPCGKIERKNHPDFLSIAPPEGKRWIRVDAIRELQAELSLKPFEADRRVVVVEDAENMNEAAQNAFLKTLEEPPPGVTIILTAPGVNYLLPTIVSRCRIVRFGPLQTGELAGILVDRKKMGQSEAALIAGLAQGSVGTALNMDADMVNRARPALLKRIVALATSDRVNFEALFGLSNQLTSLGEEALAMIRIFLRDVVFKKIGRDSIVNSDLTDAIERAAGRWGVEDVVYRFEKMVEAEEGLARNLNKNLVFEKLMFNLVLGENS